MGWTEKAKVANAYLSSIQDEILLNENKQISRIHEMEMQKKQLLQMLEQIKASQKKNYDIFSPFHDHDTEDEIQQINQKMDQLENQLKESKKELDLTISKKNSNINLLECIRELQGRVQESSDMEENVNNQKDQTSIEVKEHLGLKILETQEIERNRIACDLHDSTVQNLTSIVHKNELCMKLMDIDAVRAKLEMSVMNENIRSIINNMREIIYDLRPMSILDLGLTATIQKYVKTYMEQNQIQVIFHSDPEKKDILPVVNLTLFRIVQEACNNVQKYAHASICKITLRYKEDKIQLEIEDNGCGFETEIKKDICMPEHSGFGLSIMRERALLLGGNFELQSGKENGTKIKVSIPYQDNKGGNTFGADSYNNCR